MTPRKVRSCYRVRRGVSRTLGWAAIFSLVAPWMPVVIGTLAGVGWLVGLGSATGLMGLFLAPLLALAAPLVAFVQSRAPATVGVENGDLVILQDHRSTRIARSQIEGGVVVPSKKKPRLEVFLRDGDLVRIAIDDEATGEALLDELDIGARERRVRIELADDSRKLLVMIPRLAFTVFLWFMILGMIIQPYKEAMGEALPAVFFGPWLACMVGTFLLWQRLARPPSIEVGSDGVTLARALGERFIAYANISDVWAHGKQVFLRDHSGKVTGASGGLAAKGREHGSHASPTALAAVHRIEHARRASEGASVVAQLASKLDRAGRPVDIWRKEIANVLGSSAAYRSASLGSEDVEKILADAAAPPDRRIGAAFALKDAGVPGAPERIRIAAALTANEELRTALERVAEHDAEREAEAEAITEAVLAAEKQA